jgi:hypothetical protein
MFFNYTIRLNGRKGVLLYYFGKFGDTFKSGLEMKNRGQVANCPERVGVN